MTTGILLRKGGPLLLFMNSDITFVTVLCLWPSGCTDAFGTDWDPSQ
jgi:hypothetical protein